ncbi:protein of unknown function [Butyrivibrio sp. INlla18]|uniref:DUF4417 domain-containing protein n=1 Tax=Butyrivibrio sp. INlla18 TaxID=1520806 RepID=UPI000884588D|nr:DUF4417 domain-containing protein [Butyrivibrio sp. INlla18]SDA39016.1 protein of unknown function [Butyrivibrio sp. INlla18]
MKKVKRKAIIDDGMNPELVRGAKFDGLLEIPIIEAPRHIVIPQGITPFSARNHTGINYSEFLGFNEMDVNFAEVLINPEGYVDDFGRFDGLFSPDASLYRDAPLAVQIANVYRNRAIGSFYQRRGLYVIPQIRWGNELTYTTKVLPEKVAFLGAEKHSIVAIGTYGCISGKENKFYFEAGLEAMLSELEPQVVIVYGPMPLKIFEPYLKATRFVQFDDWTSRKKGGTD